jgi:muramoyltetrapeptide carboxypeptidase
MIIPDNLKKGDLIGIVSTARAISAEELQSSIETLKSWGLKIRLGDNIFSSYNQFAGNDIVRAIDLQVMIDDNNVKAILFARGGYGSVRIIDKINFTNLIHNPKWFIGYSDITVFHSHLNSLGIASLHATMPVNFKQNTVKAILSLKNKLFLESNILAFKDLNLDFCLSISGDVIGGNLSILYSLIGSSSDLDTDNKILFLEDLDEYLYHLDRMMISLKRNGKLSNLKALLIGSMTKMNDNVIPFGKTPHEIILEHTKDYSYPVISNFPAGHIDDNLSLILGKKSYLKIDNNNVTLLQ